MFIYISLSLMTLLDSHSVERWLYMYADALRKKTTDE